MSTGYVIQSLGLSRPPTPPPAVTLPSLPSESSAKVNYWMDFQLFPSSSHQTEKGNDHERPVALERPPNSSSERKSVHWTPSVADNHGKTPRKTRIRHSKPSIERKGSSVEAKALCPAAPDPPVSRVPLPTPRPRRLSTPDLPCLDHEDFCDCCFENPTRKMEAKRKISVPFIE